MLPTHNGESTINKKGFRYNLLMVEILIILLPCLTIYYLFFTNSVFLNISHKTIVIFTLVLVLTGMYILRQFFEKFFIIANYISKGKIYDTELSIAKKSIYDLQGITVDFNKMMEKFENTTEELKHRVFELFTLRELIEETSKILDINILFTILLEKSMVVTGAQIGSILMFESDKRRFRVVTAKGLNPGPEKDSFIDINKTMLRQMVLDKRTLIVDNIESDPRTNKPNDPKYGPPSFLSMPILLRGNLIGVLNLSKKTKKNSFDSDDEQILSIMLSEVSVAIENARLHSKMEFNLIELEDSNKRLQQEISDRRQAEEQQEKLQMQLSDAVEIARLGPWEYDVNNDLYMFNKHFYKLLRTTAEEMGGYTMSSDEYARRFIHPEDSQYYSEYIKKHIKSFDPKSRQQMEHRIFYADGLEGNIFVQSSAVRDSNNKTIKIYGVNQDITERKRMDEELLKIQKLESVGILAGGLAHDFNNILTMILGNISLARMQTSPDNGIYDLLKSVEEASIRAQALTKQLLTFSKGGTPIKEVASVKDIIEISSRFVMRGSKSRCEFSIPENLWQAEVDIGQINQVINNIVINADQSMPDGGTIMISSENILIEEGHEQPLKPGKYIKISIQDQGIGIPEKNLSRIFDPYFTTKHAGSGLGLAMTYSIMKKHDGYIVVESKPNEGTTFHIYLPASEKTVPIKEEGRLINGLGKILVMDDEEQLRKMVGRMLSVLGYIPTFVKNGTEAINKYKEALESGDPFSALILDLTVPGGMGGKETVSKLLQIDPKVNAIVSSGYSEDPILANFHEHGFKGILPKPFELKSLSKVLYEVLKGNK